MEQTKIKTIQKKTVDLQRVCIDKHYAAFNSTMEQVGTEQKTGRRDDANLASIVKRED